MEKVIPNLGDLVCYKDNQIIAFNKPAGLLAQSDNSEDKSLLNLAEIYCKHPLFIVNRIDRPASGIVLFAKNERAIANLSKQFQERKVNKEYLAWVKHAPSPASGKLEHFIFKNSKAKKAIISTEKNELSKSAILDYATVGKSDNYQLLKISLHTGRFHQIRAQLGAIKSPIKGDVKYGARRSNPDRSIALHAFRLKITHPTSNEKLTLQAPLPSSPIWSVVDLDSLS